MMVLPNKRKGWSYMPNEERPSGMNPRDDQNLQGNHEPEIEKLNLSHVVSRKRNMLGSEIRLDWNSYTGHGTKICSQVVSKVSTEAGAPQRPDKFNVGTIKGEPTDITLTPTNESDESTITARWSEDGEVRFNLERLLKVRPLAIPQGMKAYLEISRYVSKNGPILRLHLSKPRLAEIGTGKKRKTDDKQNDSQQKPSNEQKRSQPETGTEPQSE